MTDIAPILHNIDRADLDDKVMQRLFHGRGRTYVGLEQITVDWYPPALFVCLFQAIDQQWLNELVNRLWANKHELVKSIVVQHRQGANTTSEVVKGELLPQPHIVQEQDIHNLIKDIHKLNEDIHNSAGKNKRSGNLKYYVQLCNAQNVGVFPDMINGRSWVRANAADKNVLNLFSYSCLFSVAALLGGASGVINVDMNKSIMSLGQKNHRLNDIDSNRAKFLTHNIFNSWAKIKRLGRYDLIIIDPPSFQKGSFVLTKDYQRLLKRLPDLAAEQAKVMLCLNTPELDVQYLLDLVAEHCPELKFVTRLANHSSFPEIDEQCSLKVLLFEF